MTEVTPCGLTLETQATPSSLRSITVGRSALEMGDFLVNTAEARMTSTKIAILLSLGALALTPVLSRSAVAQVVTAQPGFVGVTKAAVAGCPNIGWRLARHDDGTVTGISYYADASGVSSVNGTYSKDGGFEFQVASTMGKGPNGTVVGQRGPDGGLVADLKGEGCANSHLTIQGIPNLANSTGG